MADLGSIAKSAGSARTEAPLSAFWYLAQGSISSPNFDESGTISGSVTVEGSPVEGLVVTLLFGERRIAQRRTDANGDYSFTHVAPSFDYSVVIHSPDPDTYNDQVFALPGA